MSVSENFTKNRVTVPDSVAKMYQVIQKHSGAVGGYGHNGPVYGEVTMGTFQKVVNYLVEHLGFGPDSSFLDIGAGLGKPNLHTAMDPGVKLSMGIELEELRWQLSMHNLRYALEEVKELTPEVVYFGHNDITELAHFEPITHVYMFDVGFPPAALVSIANSFNVSRTVQALVSFQRPKKIIETYGFDVTCVGQIQTRMHGSSEGHTAYIFRSNHFRPSRTTTTEPGVLKTATGETEVETDQGEETSATNIRSSPRKKRKATVRAFSPVKNRPRRQQKQISSDFFSPTKTKEFPMERTSSAKKTLFSEEREVDRLAMKPSIARAVGPDSVFKALLDQEYGEWVATTGHIGEPGRASCDRPARNSKRVLFIPS